MAEPYPDGPLIEVAPEHPRHGAQACPLHYLLPGRIALGKVTLIAGDPGLGKSFMTLDMAARVGTGAGWPDAPQTASDGGGVVLLTAEDDLVETVRPRRTLLVPTRRESRHWKPSDAQTPTRARRGQVHRPWTAT